MIKQSYVSPRRRARRTLELLGLGTSSKTTENTSTTGQKRDDCGHVDIEITDSICEWDYGDYEGLTSAKIASQRKERDEKVPWDIWSDGCPGGESPTEITARLDTLIADIREKYHGPAIGRPKGSVKTPYDVLIVAHGHILRAFAARWIGKSIADNPHMILEAGGVGTLR